MTTLDHQFQIPDDLRFEQAIAIAQTLLKMPTETDDHLRETTITKLLQTNNGARGFFVTFLTSDSPLAETPTLGIINALRSAPDTVTDLMVKNLAMSTAMALTHQANGDIEQAAGSNRVKTRSVKLIQQLQLPQFSAKLQQLLNSCSGKSDEYQDFLNRWGYDAKQRQAIQQVVADVL